LKIWSGLSGASKNLLPERAALRKLNSDCGIAIIGAGPYGLSVASALRSRGAKPRTFGEPMEFWMKQMPSGMILRSRQRASNIGDQTQHLRLTDFAATMGKTFPDRVGVEDFRAYGLWYQRQAVPDVDSRKVTKLAKIRDRFRLTLEDGEQIQATNVIVAAGISSFAHTPAQFVGISSRLASHTCSHSDLSRFRGARVIVVGSGQSAFESAALLLKNGAQVEIIMRAAKVFWLEATAVSQVPGFRALRDIMYPPTDVGPLGWHFPPGSLIVAWPKCLRMLPRPIQRIIHDASVRPAVNGWLREGLTAATITAGRKITSATADGNRVTIALDDGTTRVADHLLLGTGYRVDISRYSFIMPDLLDSIACVDGYPKLDFNFQSSVRGLYFTGAVASRSFGPLVRFVSGTEYSARTIARKLAAHWQSETSAGRSAQSIGSDSHAVHP
jgi:FAD-dependent urate hydroxylase